MTTEDYLESLQDDLNTLKTSLDLEEGTNFTDIAGMAEGGEIIRGGGGGTPAYELPTTSSSSPFDFSTAELGIYVLKTSDIGQTFYYKQNDSTTQQIKFQRIIMFVITKKASDVTTASPIGYYYYVSTSSTATENGKYYYNSIEYNPSTDTISLGSTPLMHGFLVTASTQTFTGRKTFGANPYVSLYTAPTQNYELAPKKYVDDKVASAITTTLNGNY